MLTIRGSRILLFAAFDLASALHLAATPARGAEQPIAITAGDGKFVVTAGGQPFAEVDYRTYAKPIVYPILGPGQVRMTRNHPMQPGTPGEATDHPHHKSMWFAHGDINGVSFWDERGKIITEKAELLDARTVRLENRLVDPKAPEGQIVCRETIVIRFGATDDARWIDWDATLHADPVALTFGDTKEGTMALRVHPSIQMEKNEKAGVTDANGKAINSEGVEGPEVWGKRAQWVDFHGSIDGQPVGVAFLDHPQNFRHPTYWHARGYGLFAANPFGLSSFVGPNENGAHTVPQGENFRLRYRIVFHRGTPQEADIAGRFTAFSKE